MLFLHNITPNPRVFKSDGEETGKKQGRNGDNGPKMSLKVVLLAGLEPTTLCLEGNCIHVQKHQKMAIFHDFFLKPLRNRDILSLIIKAMQNL